MKSAKKNKFLNRELSWLAFNMRVLAQAQDKQVPLLERVKFLSITSTNLDEFFMVRVGGLMALARHKNMQADMSGLTPGRQLEAIGIQVHDMVEKQYKCFSGQLEPALRHIGITRLVPNRMNGTEAEYAEHLFESEIMPVLTPIGVSDSSTLPLLANRGLHLLARIKNHADEKKEQQRFVIIPVPRATNRIITMPSQGGYKFIFAEHIIKKYIDRLFPKETVVECLSFRITRNADMSIQEDQASDLLDQMESVLEDRTRSECVRLELEASASQISRRFLQALFNAGDSMTYNVSGPVDLSALFFLNSLNGFDDFKFKPWPPLNTEAAKPGRSMFDAIRGQDILLYHPYESFDPVLKFIEEAANDPDVIAIKQVLYRTSKNSPVVAALARAAGNKKTVTALVELKARFDEERNIEWARELENAGVQVIYGLRGLKTHCKICIIMRKEPQGLQRYMHFGTGNYNEITARMYGDLSYLTSKEDYGADATAFFNTITGYSQPCQYRLLEAAPINLHKKIITLIESEAERSRQGQKTHITAKMNSLSDTRIIKALYAASQAGVKIDLNIRGVCCLRPGVKNLSDNIRVISIVDRFLEHARILSFHNGGDKLVFISSADWMPRNLDRRVELLVPITDAEAKKRCIRILETHLSDTVNAWELKNDGHYERLTTGAKKKPVRSQEELYLHVCAMTEQNRQPRIEFEPLRPPAQSG